MLSHISSHEPANLVCLAQGHGSALAQLADEMPLAARIHGETGGRHAKPVKEGFDFGQKFGVGVHHGADDNAMFRTLQCESSHFTEMGVPCETSHTMTLADTLRTEVTRRMAEKGWKAPHLAAKAGVNRRWVYDLVGGIMESPKIDTVAAVAAALDCTVGDLIGQSPAMALTQTAILNRSRMEATIRAVWAEAVPEGASQLSADTAAKLILACYDWDSSGARSDADRADFARATLRLVSGGA